MKHDDCYETRADYCTGESPTLTKSAVGSFTSPTYEIKEGVGDKANGLMSPPKDTIIWWSGRNFEGLAQYYTVTVLL